MKRQIRVCLLVVLAFGAATTPSLSWETRQSFWGTNPDFKNHLKELQQNADANPNDPEAHNFLGDSLMDNNRDIEAFKEFEKAISLDHTYPNPWSNLGVLYYKHYDYPNAIQADKNALTIDPTYIMARYNLALYYGGSGDYNQEIDQMQKCIEQDPAYRDPWDEIGDAESKLNNPSAEMAAYRKQIALTPALVDPYQLACRILIEASDFRGAREIVQAGLQHVKEKENRLLLEGDELNAEQKFDSAADLYLEAMKAGEDSYAKSCYSDALANGGHIEQAKQIWRDMAKKGTPEEAQWAHGRLAKYP